jgi:hypothetical protein
MADVVAFDQTPWKIELFEILEETFEHHHGHYLDKGTSLFETLRAIDSRQASVPVGAACAPLSAQVAHVTFYLEVLERAIFAGDEGKVDWDEIWRTVGVVTPEEWDALRMTLNARTAGWSPRSARSRPGWRSATSPAPSAWSSTPPTISARSGSRSAPSAGRSPNRWDRAVAVAIENGGPPRSQRGRRRTHERRGIPRRAPSAAVGKNAGYTPG